MQGLKLITIHITKARLRKKRQTLSNISPKEIAAKGGYEKEVRTKLFSIKNKHLPTT